MRLKTIEYTTPILLGVKDKMYLINSEMHIKEALNSFSKTSNIVDKNKINFQSFEYKYNLSKLYALIQSYNKAIQNTPQNIPSSLPKVNPSAMIKGNSKVKEVEHIKKMDIRFANIRNISFNEYFKQSGNN